MKTLSVLFSSVWLTVTAGAVGASDAFWASLPGIITSIFSGIGVILGLYLTYKVTRVNTKVDTVAKSINGLLEKKEIADEAIGAEKQKVATEREKAAGDARELEMIREQQLKDQPPAEK